MLHAICIRSDSISTLQVVALTKHIMLIPLFAKTIQTRPFGKTLEEIYSARITRRFPMLLLSVLKSQVLKGVRLKNSPVQTSNETCRIFKIVVREIYCYRSFALHSAAYVIGLINCQLSMKPRYNEPLYNEVLVITNNFLYPSNSRMLKKETQYSEQILSVSWPFVISRFYCIFLSTPLRAFQG